MRITTNQLPGVAAARGQSARLAVLPHARQPAVGARVPRRGHGAWQAADLRRTEDGRGPPDQGTAEVAGGAEGGRRRGVPGGMSGTIVPPLECRGIMLPEPIPGK